MGALAEKIYGKLVAQGPPEGNAGSLEEWIATQASWALHAEEVFNKAEKDKRRSARGPAQGL